MRSERNHVGVWHWVWMRTTRNKSSNVSNVKHHERANFIGDCTEWLWLKSARVRSGSRNNHFWLVL